jgi:hypothetical protein
MVEETIYLRKNRAFYSKIIADDKQRLYVQSVKSVFDETDELEFDIFSRDGYYLYKVKFPFSPEIIDRGHLYDIYTNEETGEVRIKRFKIANWNQIKNGI